MVGIDSETYPEFRLNGLARWEPNMLRHDRHGPDGSSEVEASTVTRPNRLREVREGQGLSRARLARLANVSDRTLARLEAGSGSSSPTTKHRIVNGLNNNPDRTREHSYNEVFPE